MLAKSPKTNAGLCLFLLTLVFVVGLKPAYACDDLCESLEKRIQERQKQIAALDAADPYGIPASYYAPSVGNPPPAAAVPTTASPNTEATVQELQTRVAQLEAAQAKAATENPPPLTNAPPPQAIAAAPSDSTASSGLVNKASSFMDSDAPLTWNGVTLYGTVDVGISNQTHGASYNPYLPMGVEEMLQKNASGSKWSVVSNGMEQSKVGLKGEEPVYKDSTYGNVNAVFKLEAGFNPASGDLSNAQQAEVSNNGNATLARTSSYGDSSRDGQAFEGAAYGGLSNETFGTLTFGRQTTALADNILAYDPQSPSYAFSPIEWSWSVAGGGDTEDSRYDDSLKYNVAYGPLRFAGIYQFAGNTNPYGGDDAYQGDVGADYEGLSLDALVGVKHDAINTSPNTTATAAAGNLDELKATTSDNNTYAFFAKYDFKDAGIDLLQPVKVFFGYEHDRLSNADTPVSLNATSLGGYQYFSITNTAYTINEKLNVVWGGIHYALTPKLTLSAADYEYMQNNFSGVSNNATCIATALTSCAGTQNYSSLVADYQLTKKIDAYAGAMYSHVYDGMAVGYLHNNTLSTTTGLRLKF
ncbi:MAG: porin [Alphaproteobacteria bacterium]